jgi:competence protein ComEC
MSFGISIMLSVGRFVSGLPGATSAVSAWPVATLVLVSFGGLWTALWRRSWRWLGAAPVLMGLALAFVWRGPDILVARDASTVAIRGGDGVLRLVRRPSDAYSADEWLKRDGDARLSADAVATPAAGVRCDAYGCIATGRDGTLIAATARIDALEEDCAKAAIVVAAVPAGRFCTAPRLVIDRFDVARTGGYAIWLGRTLRVETVEGERGTRPWAAPQYRRMRPTSLPWTRTRSAP